MADSTSSNEDSLENADYKEEYELNLEMWKHYDNLRQEKSKTFLTAQTILIAISGFVLKSQEISPALRIAVLAVFGLGFVSSFLWFVLLTRNKAYIDFHRKRVQVLERCTAVPFTTFTKQRKAIEKEKGNRWPLLWLAWVSSNTIDRVLALFFALFWLCLCAVGLNFYF